MMKNFLLNLLWFCIPVVLCLELMTRTFDGEYKRKRDGLLDCADSIEVLILGNSHAGDGIDPAQFDLFAYNLAFGSQTIYFDKRLALKYVDSLPRLKYVLLSVDYQSFYYLHRSARDKYYHYYHGIDFDNKQFWLEDLSHFWFGFGPKIALANMVKSSRPMYRGWTFHERTMPEMMTETWAQERATYFQKVINDNKNHRNRVVSDLRNLLESLSAQGIRCLLVTHPLHPKIYSKLDPEVWKENLTVIDELAEDPLVTYYDYGKYPLADDQFYNLDHLNRAGARKYSQSLNSIIVELEPTD